MPKEKQVEEGLVCPLCGNTYVNSAGIPFPEGGRTVHYYQCQSDREQGPSHRGRSGCGYLADKQEFRRAKL